jgi:hypothetical protein
MNESQVHHTKAKSFIKVSLMIHVTETDAQMQDGTGKPWFELRQMVIFIPVLSMDKCTYSQD